MPITIDQSDLQQFVDDQVALGHFKSPEQVVSFALARLREDLDGGETLDAESIAAINLAEEQIASGKYLTARQVRAKFENEVFRK